MQAEIDRLGVETDGDGWRAKVFLYCVEARCPQTGWIVPLLPSLVVSKGYRVVAKLLPDAANKCYEIDIRSGVSDTEMRAAEVGTIGREGKYGEAYMIHQVDGVDYKTKISTLRGDYQKPDGTIGNRLRLWEKHDFKHATHDILQERLYCVQWMRRKKNGKADEYEFRAVMPEDLERERNVEAFLADHIIDWQAKGWLPDMRIEVGGPPRYQGLDLIKARGWTHWQHAFNGDAVKYEEILDFFIAWLRKNQLPEFANWVWDSRRALAIQGEDEDFRRGMVAAYRRITECMPDSGIQVIMFTHQSGTIWADMANIVWALQVTTAGHVVTETDSPLREGSYVKGTVLLVLRKRQGAHKTTRDDLAWEIQEEVEAQVAALIGLNQQAKACTAKKTSLRTQTSRRVTPRRCAC